jgi:hypothetical protein
MKKVVAGIIALCSIFCMTGCGKKVVNKENLTVEATVVDKDHSPAWTQPIWTGKFMIMTVHPATWGTTFQYESYSVRVSGSEVYNQYNIGDTAECELVTYYYDDDSIKIKLEYKK